MKLFVKFSQEIGLGLIEKQINPGQSIQNLEVLISLNYDRMGECKLVYQGATLNNKNALVRDVINVAVSNEIVVARKNELQDAAVKMGTMIQLFQQNPMAFAGTVVVLFFIILYIMGQSS